MNYYGAKELADRFRTVRKNTLIIANDIPEEHYGFRAAPEIRSIAEMLVHVAITPRVQERIHGTERRTSLRDFDFPGVLAAMRAEEQTARSKAQIIALLQEGGDHFSNWIESLTDEFLGERVNFRPGMVPPFKSRFEMLLAVKEHEMHHRGQLMLMERMLGIVPHLTREMQARLAEPAAAEAGAKA